MKFLGGEMGLILLVMVPLSLSVDALIFSLIRLYFKCLEAIVYLDLKMI